MINPISPYGEPFETWKPSQKINVVSYSFGVISVIFGIASFYLTYKSLKRSFVEGKIDEIKNKNCSNKFY